MTLGNTNIEKRLFGIAFAALLASIAPSPADASEDEVGKILEGETRSDFGASCPMPTMLEMGASDPPDSCPLC